MDVTELRRRIETDLDTLYKLCREGLSKSGVRHDAREFPMIEEARIELATPLAKFRIVTEKLAVRL